MAEGGEPPYLDNVNAQTPAEYRTLLVQGLTPDITKELLELYFENSKYGGGDIESLSREIANEARIVYKQHGIVENVLEHGTHRLHDQDLSVCRPPPDETKMKDETHTHNTLQMGVNAILVEGLKPDMGREFLEIFFESKKHSGGGDINLMRIYEKSRRAIIWYSNPEDAQRVIARSPLTLSGCVLRISQFLVEPMVRVSGVNDKHRREMLKLFFESEKRSGGGDIKQIDLFLQLQIAIITFEDEQVADRVVERKEFTVAGCTLTAERHYGMIPLQAQDKADSPTTRLDEPNACEVPSTKKGRRSHGKKIVEKRKVVERSKASVGTDTSEEESTSDTESDLESCTIEVSGVHKDTSEETLRLFFENRRTSGGGKIDGDIVRDKKNAKYIITFTDREAVVRVLKKETHVLDSKRLTITEMQSACEPRELQENRRGPMDPYRVYISGLNERITRDQLTLNLEERINCDVDDVVYGLDPSIAMVSFNQKLDFRNLKKALAKKPVAGCMLGVEKVPYSRSLQVFNIGNISEDSLSAYFENTRRSGGSGEAAVKIYRQHGYAIVTFDNHKIASQVVQKSKHIYESQTLQLKTYRERFGMIPIDHDTSQPCLQIPSDLVIGNIDPNIVKYLSDIAEVKRQLENDVMKERNGEINWNHQRETELCISCTIKKDDNDARSKVKDWEDAVGQSMHFFISNVSVKKRECLKKTWADVCAEAKKVRKANPTIAVIERTEEHALYIVGPGNAVKKIHQQVDQICSEIEQKLEHIKDSVKISNIEKALIEKAELVKSLLRGHPNLKISMGQGELVFEGPARDLLDTQKELNSFTKALQIKKLNLSKGQQQVLKMAREQQDNPIDIAMMQYTAVMQIEENRIVLAGPDEDVNKCEEIISRNIKDATIEVAEDEGMAFREKIWEDFTDDMSKKFNRILHLEYVKYRSVVNVVTYKEDLTGVLEEIRNHIKKNAIKEEILTMDVAHTRMISQWMARDLRKIERDFQSYSIQIESPGEGFQIRGTHDGLQPASARVVELTKKIIADSHTVTTPGMPYYFTQVEAGISFIEMREKKYNVVIHYEKANGSRVKKQGNRATIEGGSAPYEVEQAIHTSGVVIKVIVGDMTAHKVDAIVNAANSELRHHGGLAKAIADKGGRVIVEESNEYIKQNGPLMEGHAVLTGAGNLPCKKVVHAVGPRWRGGRFGEEDVLYDCVFGHILKIAKQENFKTIAIPAISAGVFGFPVEVSTAVIVEAITNFLDEKDTDTGSLSKIHLFDNRKEGGQAFADALRNRLKMTKPAKLKKPVHLPRSRGVPIRTVQRDTSFRTSEGLTITLKKGAISQERVNMIFNTTANGLRGPNLDSGAVSKSILQAAGQGIQTEVTQQCPQGLQPGQHVTSSGGNLNCQLIFHAVLREWDRGKGRSEQMMKNIIADSLQLAGQKGFTSIALPAMGTGNLRFPRDVVADTMFSSVIEFSKANPTTSLKDVRFVLYDKDQPTVDAFDDHLSKLNGSSADDGAVGTTTSQRKVFKDEGGEIQIGSIRLQVVSGDITQEKTDAIVNGTNMELDLSMGAVSQAIANAAGETLVAECDRKSPINHHGVAITSGGKLFAKNVIHLHVSNSKYDWKKGITKCLEEAGKAGLTSLSFPALGTGMLDLAPATMADNMMEAIADFSKKNKNTSIDLVRVVIFQKDMVPTYVQQMEKATKPGSVIIDMVKAPIKSIRKVWKGFSEFFSSGPSVMDTDAEREDSSQARSWAIPKTSANLEFMILGLNKESIKAVKEEIDKCCSDEAADKYISGPEFSDIIKGLSPEQVEELTAYGNKTGAKITVDLGPKMGRIRLQGQSKDVYQAESHVQEILYKVKAELKEEEEAVVLAQFVQWECKEGNNQFQAYPAEINIKLERANRKGELTVTWNEEDDGGPKQWTIDLEKLTETGGGITKEVKRRVIAEGANLPDNWTNMSGSNTFELVQLGTDDKEYQTVSQEFMKTCTRQIIKIERLQNKSLYERYQLHKGDMEARKPKYSPYERQLWHGTDPNAINSINTYGFNRSYCGKNATVYGRGAYFALEAKYSEKYTEPNSNGHCKMYFARVLTGEYTVGNHQMKTPPSKDDPSNPSLHFDTTVNKLANPDIFVTYYDTQAYPEYIVTFQSAKRDMDTRMSMHMSVLKGMQNIQGSN